MDGPIMVCGMMVWCLVRCGMDGPIMAEKPTNLFLLDNASSDKGPKLLRNSAKVGAVQFGDLSAGDVTPTKCNFLPFNILGQISQFGDLTSLSLL